MIDEQWVRIDVDKRWGSMATAFEEEHCIHVWEKSREMTYLDSPRCLPMFCMFDPTISFTLLCNCFFLDLIHLLLLLHLCC